MIDLLWMFQSTHTSNPTHEVGPPLATCGRVLGVGKGGIVVGQQRFANPFVVSTTGWRVAGQVGGSESVGGVLGESGLAPGEATALPAARS